MKGSQKVFTEDDKKEQARENKHLESNFVELEEVDLRSKWIR